MKNIPTLSTKMNLSNGVVGAAHHDLVDASRHSQGRIMGSELFAGSDSEEVLVVEDRARLRPAQVVETKLTRLLQEAVLPVSHLQMRGLLKTR